MTRPTRSAQEGKAIVNDADRPLLVFFWSERSGPARRMESLLAHLERKERQRLRVRRVDVDANPELAARFQVAVVPTLVLVKDKNAVSRLDGRTSAPRIEAMLEPHLPVELAVA
jgi:thioredoxin-like negative regulator of GroEL